MISASQLIIISGLGDRTASFERYVVPLWRRKGYKVHVFSFGWEDGREDFATARGRLINFINKLPDAPVDIIGVSAGGAAALHALLQLPQRINRVVTVATPYYHELPLRNSKLEAALDDLAEHDLTPYAQRVLSVYGLYDQAVAVRFSARVPVATWRIFAVRHFIIIALALTVYSSILHDFLRSRSPR